MSRRFWRARYNIRDYYGVYYEAPPPQPEDVQAIGRSGAAHPFRLKWNLGGDRTAAADLPNGANGLLMNLRAAGVLLPLVSPWTSIQSDVLVGGQPSHVLAIVTQTYDAMNTKTTKGRYHESGIWLEVTELHLIASKIGPSPIFRVPNAGVQRDYMLSDEIVTAIRAHALTGLLLEEVVVED